MKFLIWFTAIMGLLAMVFCSGKTVPVGPPKVRTALVTNHSREEWKSRYKSTKVYKEYQVDLRIGNDTVTFVTEDYLPRLIPGDVFPVKYTKNSFGEITVSSLDIPNPFTR